MCDVSKLLHIILFADETNIFYSAINIDDVTNVVNNELKQLGLWFRANKLSLNVNKTNFIMFNNTKQLRTDVHIVTNGINIEQVTNTKFLGVTIDENLTWREHIKMVETKVSKSIAVLYKTMHVLDCQALHILYQSLVEPHMSYYIYMSRLKKLFLLQKKAIRIIDNLNYHDHTSVFFHSSTILKLHDFVTLARNMQATSICATPCISRMAIRSAAVLFRWPSASRLQRIAAPCDDGRLSGALRSYFGGLLPVGLDVLQPLCEDDPVELRLHDVYWPLVRGYTLTFSPRK